MPLINVKLGKFQTRYIVDRRFTSQSLAPPAKLQELGLQHVGYRIDRSRGFGNRQNVTLLDPRHPTPE